MELFNGSTIKTIRTYDIEVISIPIVYNKYGDHDPNGLLFVLKNDANRIKERALENFRKVIPQPYDEVRPLVLRANVGDEIVVHLSTTLNRRVSMHVQGLSYDVNTSDGTCVGFNTDSTTADVITYRWYAEREGVYQFCDMADTRSGEEGSNVHGLFGAIIIEASEATWYDPVTGDLLESGLFADIYHPINKSFREYTVFFHDELEIKDRDGTVPMDPHTGLSSGTTGISYRSEPMRNRNPEPIQTMFEMQQSEGHIVKGEDISMSSWIYGDPAPEILRAYVGDPAKIRLIHGGIKETHVFHLHNHQWALEPNNPNSTIIDSISISPGECYTLDILYGAGSLNGMIGDAIWHCHLYPHFHEGMWSLWRVFDRLEDGTGRYPDGTVIARLVPLKDRPLPPSKDYMHPGFPSFINGQAGKKPLQPPLGVLTPEGNNKIKPTQLERVNFVAGYVPGALYSKSCRENTNSNEKLKVFEIALVQAKVIYNRYGWNDPQGRFFVLKEDLIKHGGLKCYINKVESGCIMVEPLVIRANAGDCIEIQLTNLLPELIQGNAFQLKTLTDIAGYHIHLVKFDTIVSDGGANGWNNIAGARKYETLIERFYAEEELRTVFFHDHLNANTHQQHGVFGALIIEAAGSSYHDICTGEEIQSGTKAVIRNDNQNAFREFVLFVHDFALLFDRDGNPLNAPEVPGSHEDPGVMGINYRAEPMRERLKKWEDPANIFNSNLYGDPATPILETYPGDEMVIRLVDGAHEEQHSFNLLGMSWKKEINDKHSPYAASQTIGISEAFNFRIDQPYSAGDFLYYFGGIDDVWLGLWGIIRAYGKPINQLLPLCNEQIKSNSIPLYPEKDAVIRKYKIAAIQKFILYNKYGDHDPEGLLFVPMEQLKDVLLGRITPKPLILRANVGDWIEVTLFNRLKHYRSLTYHDYPSVPLDIVHEPSNRVSINPQFLMYDNLKSSGVNVGYNEEEQTVGPGESKKYLWYADKEYGACTIQSFGDLRNHRYHGLFGTIIIEPQGAKWYSKKIFERGDYKEQVVVTAPGMESYREFVVMIQNGIRMLDKNGELIKTAMEEHVMEQDTAQNLDLTKQTKLFDIEEKTTEQVELGINNGSNIRNEENMRLEHVGLVDENDEWEACIHSCFSNKDVKWEQVNYRGENTNNLKYVCINKNRNKEYEKQERENDEHENKNMNKNENKEENMEPENMEPWNMKHENMEPGNMESGNMESGNMEHENKERENIEHGDVDAEDTGEKGYNYRSERFHNRLNRDNDISKVFSSKTHGDPSTPIFKAHAGERVIFRVLMPADKPRNVGFTIHGHMWKEQPQDPFSRVIPLQGAISIGNVFNMELEGKASTPGDYLYRSGSLKWDVESGMWGIFRVVKRSRCYKIRKCIERKLRGLKKRKKYIKIG